jgi:hypothetical protein
MPDCDSFASASTWLLLLSKRAGHQYHLSRWSRKRGPLHAELFQAYQRGFDEGHDNDGLTAALIELAAADPAGVRQVLEALVKSGNEAMRENAEWLMEFCQNEWDA